jgi:hypothetical protein
MHTITYVVRSPKTDNVLMACTSKEAANVIKTYYDNLGGRSDTQIVECQLIDLAFAQDVTSTIRA